MANDSGTVEKEAPANSPPSSVAAAFGNVAVQGHGASVVIQPNGDVIVNGKVIVHANGNVEHAEAGPAAAAPQEESSVPASAPWTKEMLDKIQDGEEYPDGTVRFGKALTLKDGFYRAAMPQDAESWMNHRNAQSYAQKLNAHGHADYRLPDSPEGSSLYAARTEGRLKDAFTEERGYWLAERDSDYARVQWFGGGLQDDNGRSIERPVRCVRRFTI